MRRNPWARRSDARELPFAFDRCRPDRGDVTRWAIVTGEYPPQPGGVGDYTRLVVEGLRGAGDEVRVYTSGSPPALSDESHVRRLPEGFGLRSLLWLNSSLRDFSPDRILVEYVPHAFGWKAMNLPFAWTMARAAKRIAPLWMMFHEVMFPIDAWRPWRLRVLGRANRRMAATLAHAAERNFASISAWAPLLADIAPGSAPAQWLPVPSNLPTDVDSDVVAQVRTTLAAERRPIVGHFGTYNGFYVHALEAALAKLLESDVDCSVLLIGRGADAFRVRFTAGESGRRERVTSRDALPPAEAGAHIAACDVMLQPYHDGASCRRGTLMAALALGRPIVTNLGENSESIWSAGRHGIRLTSNWEPEQLAAGVADELRLSESDRRARGLLNRTWYDENFSLKRTIARLKANDR